MTKSLQNETISDTQSLRHCEATYNEELNLSQISRSNLTRILNQLFKFG
jgi:hypothetical protein